MSWHRGRLNEFVSRVRRCGRGAPTESFEPERGQGRIDVNGGSDAGAVRESVSVFSLDAAQTCRGKGWPGDGSKTSVTCLCRLEGVM